MPAATSRRLARRLVVLALVLGAGPGAAELGAAAVTRLWHPAPDGATPACTAVYVRDPAERSGSGGIWLLTARHCAAPGPIHVGRGGPETPFTPAPGAAVRAEAVDVAIGSVAKPHPALDLAERMPRTGTVVIHGFAFGVEHLTAARVVGESTERPGSVELRVVTGPQTDAGPGFSGAPVLDAEGRVVGTLWGLRGEGDQALRAFVTPVEAIRDLLSRVPR